MPPDPFPSFERVEAKIGKQPYVRFDRNDYSVPHEHVRRTVTVWAGPDIVRVADGEQIVAEHARSFAKGAQIEDPAHIEALAAAKREGRAGRGMDRLHHAVPASTTLLEGAARRGHNLGAAVAGLLRLLDTWGPDALQDALLEAIQSDALHVAAVRQVLEQRHQDAGQPPPIPVELPDDPRVRDQQVRTHDLATYDTLRKKS